MAIMFIVHMSVSLSDLRVDFRESGLTIARPLPRPHILHAANHPGC